jgi:hypothetical protein
MTMPLGDTPSIVLQTRVTETDFARFRRLGQALEAAARGVRASRAELFRLCALRGLAQLEAELGHQTGSGPQ